MPVSLHVAKPANQMAQHPKNGDRPLIKGNILMQENKRDSLWLRHC
jgi:hypothetical protein